ncbi:trigger factor [Coriobacterium glomerans PW2]|uniref:Trigger factor n=1 Tax=Coriobacterium glomerans (strain ATCC 49209 / DSM 20642 / JCM 10262 / PW2) TaxID=700015 RepID=F2N7M6_CORGP|nr:trigger factor [Coriobacterium glomerans]AEB06918.1 trigger factor [Coriobacterium glomerans PW2]
MNITASDVKDGKLAAEVTIPAVDVDAAIRKAYRDAAHKYRFPGFRAGKAPRPVIDNMLGAQAVLAQATNDLVGATEPKVLNELDIVPVKEASYDDLDIVKDRQDFSYNVTFPLRPEAELSSYDPVEIEMPPEEVTAAEIDAQIDMLVGYHATFKEIEDRGIADDDFVTVDIKDIHGGESLAGQGRMIAMGSGNLPSAFDEGLIGSGVGDTKEISWTPEETDAEEASVEVTIKGIRHRELPELTDEFAKTSFGFDGVDAMRDAVKLELEQDKSSKLPGLKEQRSVSALAERLELTEMDKDYESTIFSELGQNFLQNLSQRGMTLDAWLKSSQITSEQFIADLHHQADDVARESLALDALARKLDIEVSDEDVDAEFERAGVDDPAASKESFIAEGRLPAVRDSIRRSKAIEWLVGSARVSVVDEAARRAEADDDADEPSEPSSASDAGEGADE